MVARTRFGEPLARVEGRRWKYMVVSSHAKVMIVLLRRGCLEVADVAVTTTMARDALELS